MARLLFWILFSALLYGGYWFGAARAVDQAIIGMANQARLDGWKVDYAMQETSGFPGDFDVRLDQIDLVAAGGALAWQAPNLHIHAPGLRPTNLTVTLPQTQVLRVAGQTLRIEANTLVLAAATRLNMSLGLREASMGATEAAVQSDAGWRVGLDRANALLQRQDGGDGVYDFDLAARGITLPLEQIARAGLLANTIDEVELDAEITLDRNLDRFTLAGDAAPPAVRYIGVTSFAMVWGDIALDAFGAVDVDEEGVLDGRVIFRTAHWQEVIDALVVIGIIDRGVAPTLKNMAAAMVDAEGMLELPVTFRDGFMSMGLLPLGPAPRLR